MESPIRSRIPDSERGADMDPNLQCDAGCRMGVGGKVAVCVLVTVSMTMISSFLAGFNVLSITTGHLALRYIPIPLHAIPYRQPYIDNTLLTTCALAALGSSIFVIPFFTFMLYATVRGVLLTTDSKGSPSPSALPKKPTRLTPSILYYLIHETWLISSGPIGVLLYHALYPGAAPVLNGGHAALAAAVGRLLYHLGKYARSLFRKQADAGLAAESEHLKKEVVNETEKTSTSFV